MEVASLVIGFLLGLVPGWVARGRRLRGHWAALRAELELCADRGEALLTHHVGAPLYRFPTMAYEPSLPTCDTSTPIGRLSFAGNAPSLPKRDPVS
jgi:hypothetical protein